MSLLGAEMTYTEYVNQAYTAWLTHDSHKYCPASPYICDCLCVVIDRQRLEDGLPWSAEYAEIAPLLEFVSAKIKGKFGIEAFLFNKSRLECNDEELEIARAEREALWAELRVLSAELDVSESVAKSED